MKNSFLHFRGPAQRGGTNVPYKRFAGGKSLKSAGFTPDDLSQMEGLPPGGAGWGTMKEASKMLEFEYAAVLRDQIIELRGQA